ncbi:uncharacterized protein BJ212DRAFT_1480165 [Suillus subaureus]|uniref:Uncharacterized protein n=1 Tax=Suillus subaureus TaxID=48587 RepID=A0A9P7EC61_9AGAM|nr:uncharacterized protein BJ212DRAFT_1480165 [Suillus subaureus]KAG1817606.1 hypothetical protein BJ212DRAFT_1480165 [Suillus subaureus]
MPKKSSLSVGWVPSPITTPIYLAPETLENAKAAASTAMVTAIFQKTLFPDANVLTQCASDTVDKVIAEYLGETHAGLTQWKLRSEGSQHMSRMKGKLKQVYINFQNVTKMSMLSAYGLAFEISKSKQEMMNLCIANIQYLLLNHNFEDVFEPTSVDDLELLLVPFGHAGLCNLLEYLTSVKQYSRYLLLNQDSWKSLP